MQSGGEIHELKIFDLRESMYNGGDPACLRYRVVQQAREYVIFPNAGVAKGQRVGLMLAEENAANKIAGAG